MELLLVEPPPWRLTIERADLVHAYVRLLRANEAEVRIAAAGKVTKFCRILSPHLAIHHILPCVKELSSDSSQHVRSALASVIMGMAPVLGKVFSIRAAAANNLKRLAEEFSPERAMQHIIPQVLEKINNPHYLYRMTILQAISLLAPIMGAEITCQKLLPVVINSSKDRVPNIKFNVAKVLRSLVPILDQSIFEEEDRRTKLKGNYGTSEVVSMVEAQIKKVDKRG